MKWINVKDELPDLEKDVLFCEELAGNTYVSMGVYGDNFPDGIVFYDLSNYSEIDGHISSKGVEYWMYPPKPPIK